MFCGFQRLCGDADPRSDVAGQSACQPPLHPSQISPNRPSSLTPAPQHCMQYVLQQLHVQEKFSVSAAYLLLATPSASDTDEEEEDDSSRTSRSMTMPSFLPRGKRKESVTAQDPQGSLLTGFTIRQNYMYASTVCKPF